jgi:hypothetical protein
MIGTHSLNNQNTGKSYSVTANLQTVHSLLKSHNPTLCTICSTKDCDQDCEKPELKKAPAHPKPRAVSAPVKKVASNKKNVPRKAASSKPKPVVIPSKTKADSSTNSVLLEKLKELEAEFRALKQ